MTESSRFFLILIGSLFGVIIVTQIIGFLWMLFLGSWQAYRDEDDTIPWEQRKQSLKDNFEAFTTDRNTKEIRSVTIGWRPDPINKNDGFTEVQGPTRSGNREYYRVIRNGKK